MSMQTRKGSVLEQLCNVGSGFIVSLIYWQFAVVPQLNTLHGQELSFLFNLWITIQFTVISVIRGYIWRRYFNNLLGRGYFVINNSTNKRSDSRRNSL